MAKTGTHKWEFARRFRQHAFGWRSEPAIQRVKEAVSEIRKVARRDPVLAAEGAVAFLERVSPALENVDSSSGAIGTAVNRAIAALVPLIAAAPADAKTRAAWLERLYEAHAEDEIPYIEQLAEYWGDLCASTEVACEWADRLLGITREALSPDPAVRGHYHFTSGCLSALYRAARYDELIELVQVDVIWPYKRWAVKALAAQGHQADALRYAEACRSRSASDWDVDRLCEDILLSSGMVEEAYARYGLSANRGGTYLATFRAVASKYPHKDAGEILADLVETTPGQEGKWFAAAKEAGLFEEALSLARQTPCDPRTLARAARDHLDDQPSFALNAGLLAMYWLAQGIGYEIEAADVRLAFEHTMRAADRLGQGTAVQESIRTMAVEIQQGASFVARVLQRELGLPWPEAEQGTEPPTGTPAVPRTTPLSSR